MTTGFYSLEDTKERLGKSEQELRNLAGSGALNMIEDGDAVWFSAADVDDASSPKPEPNLDLDVAPEEAPAAPAPKAEAPPDITEVPIALEPEDVSREADGTSKIKAFGGTGISAAKGALDTSSLKRNVNVTGTGATRCRTFHSKLNDSSLAYLNSQVNEWADGDPAIDIKFATSSVGVVEGKHAEPHLIVTVFY